MLHAARDDARSDADLLGKGFDVALRRGHRACLQASEFGNSVCRDEPIGGELIGFVFPLVAFADAFPEDISFAMQLDVSGFVEHENHNKSSLL